MYNIDFLPQLEAARRHLGLDRYVPESARYMPPPDVKMIPCHEDTNGEWVPDDQPLSEKE
jgi:hypothetical protein